MQGKAPATTVQSAKAGLASHAWAEPAVSPSDALLKLQCQIGNRAVSSWVRSGLRAVNSDDAGQALPSSFDEAGHLRDETDPRRLDFEREIALGLQRGIGNQATSSARIRLPRRRGSKPSSKSTRPTIRLNARPTASPRMSRARRRARRRRSSSAPSRSRRNSFTANPTKRTPPTPL